MAQRLHDLEAELQSEAAPPAPASLGSVSSPAPGTEGATAAEEAEENDWMLKARLSSVEFGKDGKDGMGIHGRSGWCMDIW